MFTNFGGGIVASADLRYNGANEKPLPWGEVAAEPTERANRGENIPSHPLSRELSQRESLRTRNLRGMGFARCICNTKAKPAIKGEMTV